MDAGFDEALWLNEKGLLVEGSGEYFWYATECFTRSITTIHLKVLHKKPLLSQQKMSIKATKRDIRDEALYLPMKCFSLHCGRNDVCTTN